MPVIDVKPLVLKDVTFISSLSGAPSGTSPDFKKHIDAVTFTPTTSSVTWTGLGSNTHTDVSTATWTCVINYVQDWETTDSLSKYLFNNEGAELSVVFKPRSAGTTTVTAKLVAAPGAIGGTVNAYATTSVTLGVNGKPVIS
ncbi:hypothetical protein FB00_11230 [Cellulosimicrobium funkei]|uniref:Phage tail protein n=1 Tax=Cellulosimicrobium funkei TaxID=264251 RepID=A0A0H2L353_9MICO|nr:hypothetical protein [Cellulosimicrobium funkei]KLN34572.1 hypothetical protein FB00_11230 [Cellulosimicrobium funkei]